MRASGLILIFVLAGCGDDGGLPDAGRDDGGLSDGAMDGDVPDAMADARPDVPRIDVGTPDAGPPLGVGQPCDGDGDCPPDLFCLDETDSPGLPPQGYCTRTCGSDVTCGGGALCAPPFDAGGVRVCLATCDAGGGCAESSHVCSERLLGLLDVPRPICFPGDPTAADGDACGSAADCNANSFCLDNPFNTPGGYCVTAGCTVGDDSTCAPGGDGVCVNFGTVNGCVDPCTASGDCRTAEGYDCVPAGTIRLCAYPVSEPGAACAMDTDCGPSPWECLTGPLFPGGSCGATGCDPADERTCPSDALCYDPDPGTAGDERCVPRCAGAGDCRTMDGYECLPSGAGMGCRVPRV